MGIHTVSAGLGKETRKDGRAVPRSRGQGSSKSLELLRPRERCGHSRTGKLWAQLPRSCHWTSQECRRRAICNEDSAMLQQQVPAKLIGQMDSELSSVTRSEPSGPTEMPTERPHTWNETCSQHLDAFARNLLHDRRTFTRVLCTRAASLWMSRCMLTTTWRWQAFGLTLNQDCGGQKLFEPSRFTDVFARDSLPDNLLCPARPNCIDKSTSWPVLWGPGIQS